MTEEAPADRWLFLTPEIEREVPALLGALLGDMVASGDADAWFAVLRAQRALLDAALLGGADRRRVARFAAILLEQYLLAPSVRDLDARDLDEQAHLVALVNATGSPA